MAAHVIGPLEATGTYPLVAEPAGGDEAVAAHDGVVSTRGGDGLAEGPPMQAAAEGPTRNCILCHSPSWFPSEDTKEDARRGQSVLIRMASSAGIMRPSACPRLASRDPVVVAGHVYELIVVFVVLALMVLKPF